MIATKEQERKALEKIKAIIAGLGEQSYIAMAFDGCIEDADENIENDFAFSMKQRYEKTLAELNECKSEIEAHIAHTRRAEKDVENIKNQLDAEKSEKLSPDEINLCRTLVSESYIAIRKLAEENAEKIVALAEETGSAEFLNAVKQHRINIKKAESAKSLIDKIDTLCNARRKDVQ